MEPPSSPAFPYLPGPDTSRSTPPQRRALVVLGMHRSGTSAVAGCLQRLGVEFGPRLMPATEANARGYYEHIDVVNLHDRLLLALDRGWDTVGPWPERWWEDETRTGRFRTELLGLLQRDFGSAPLWGIKDPRLCRLLPWWRPLWPVLDTEPIFLFVVRDPREVAVSLGRREGISQTKCYLLWLQYLLDAERETQGCQRCFLSYEDFLRDWESSLAPLERFLGPQWGTTLAAGREAIRQFLDGSLRHASATASELGPLPPWLAGAYRTLAACCGPGGDPAAASALESVRQDGPGAEWTPAITAETRLSDLTVELAATRKLARWYESEWQKAKRQAEGRQKLPKRKSVLSETASVKTINNDISISNKRIQYISIMRKQGALWLRYLTEFFGR